MVIPTPRKELTMARISNSPRVSRRLATALALTGALVSAGSAMAIPVNGGGGPPPNEPPIASLTGTPNPVVVPPALNIARLITASRAIPEPNMLFPTRRF